MRDLLGTSHHTHLIEGADLGTQSTVDTQNLAVDDGAQRHEIENLAAGLPHGCTPVLLETFLVETVYLSDLSGFVVTAHQCHPIGISVRIVRVAVTEAMQLRRVHSLRLETQQQCQSLQTEISAIDVITKENKVAVEFQGGGGLAGGASVRGFGVFAFLVIMLRSAQLLSDLGIGDGGWGFDVGGGDDGGGGLRGIELGAIWHSARDAEQLEKVVELAVDITADGNGSSDGLNIGF